MHLDFEVGRKDEQRLQVLDVPFDALSLVPVGPCHDDIRGVTFLEAIPFLIAEHVEIERVEYLEVFLHGGILLFVGRGAASEDSQSMTGHSPMGARPPKRMTIEQGQCDS